jgi:hypothetical protein
MRHPGGRANRYGSDPAEVDVRSIEIVGKDGNAIVYSRTDDSASRDDR